MSLTLAERDKLLEHIQREIKNKRDLIVKKTKDIDNKQNMNAYLVDVKSDYNKYYSYMLKQKQQQHDSLVLLKEYMQDLITTDNLANEQLRIAKHDQKQIVDEIDKVKAELDKLIQQ